MKKIIASENQLISNAGKRGEAVRADCYTEIKLKKSGGIKIKIQSKVEAMYGDSIKDQAKEMCRFFQIKNAEILIEDSGALSFVIAARFELAVKKLFPNSDKEFLLPSNKANYKTSKDKLRRSRLYLPGNEPKFFINAGLHKPDGVILDLEDSVTTTEKKAAQLLVRNALRSVDFYSSEKMVRINKLPLGLDDLKFIVPHNIHVVLIPKSESDDQIQQVEQKVDEIKKQHNFKDEIYFIPIIETALGVIKAYEIASASKNNCALAIGLEDYTADIGAERTNEGKESFFARSMVLNAAKAAGIQALDTVFSNVSDVDGLRKSTVEAKSLGFDGKGCIHPRQISIVHKAFAPTETEINDAKNIVLSYEEAEKKGRGVVSLKNKMIDAPVVKSARRIIKLAIINNLLPNNWRES